MTAQNVIIKALRAHPAVLDDPEPAAIVDSMGTSTVNIRACNSYSFFKVRSSLMRQIKRALQDAGVSMPDAAREIIFPQGVQLRPADTSEKEAKDKPRPPVVADKAESATVSTGEGNLKSEQAELQRQAMTTDRVQNEYNLLTTSDDISGKS